ncbi:hypothetical protein E0Z10_g5207 [Xylaria hypoxylon]|uniref:Mid2 domain-containing protein n=1 Tax=Xylaria hypoxylon TaxID=37992 RepID=A0A4Z0Z4H9_9PEZI|nr:hypothetical protein E0Z10_g5207 [Xylaria hypoxylon]
MRYLLILLLAALVRVEADNQFISPRNHTAEAPGYAANTHWPLGSSQLIAFQTNWVDYSIELWQQQLNPGPKKSSNLVYVKSRDKDLPQSFYWTIQTYELLLSDSRVFFFRLQDNNSSAGQASPFFNITIATAAPSSAARKTAMISTTTAAPTAPTASTISTILTISPEASFPTSSPPEPAITSQGISAVGAAGVGVGVTFGAILVAVIVGFACSRRRNRQKQQQQPVELQGHE